MCIGEEGGVRRKREHPTLPPGFACWQPASYLIATPAGPQEAEGFTYRGIGLHLVWSMKGRRPRKDGTRKTHERWSVTHVNTGHLIRVFVDLPRDQMLRAATALAELTEWDFDGLDGWKNRDPDLPDKLQAWHAEHQLAARQAGMGPQEQQAQAIGATRW